MGAQEDEEWCDLRGQAAQGPKGGDFQSKKMINRWKVVLKDKEARVVEEILMRVVDELNEI